MPFRKHIICTTISLTRLKIRITCNLGHMTSAAYTYIFSCQPAKFRLQGFHITENFLKSIGFLMKDGGIEERFRESGIWKSGTANKVTARRDYYKMVRCDILVSEGMVSLAWDAFEE